MNPRAVQVIVHALMIVVVPMQFWAAALSSSAGIFIASMVIRRFENGR